MTQRFTSAVRSHGAHFFSDTHLFHPFNGAACKHLCMLYASKAGRFFGVGDVFDFQAVVAALEDKGFSFKNIPKHFDEVLDKIQIPDLETHLRFVDMLMWKADTGTDVNLLGGNHDPGFDLLAGRKIYGLNIRKETIYDTGRKKFQVEHGHMFDPAYFQNFSGVYAIGSYFLSRGLWVDHQLGKTVPSLRKTFFVSNSLKKAGKFYVRSFIKRAMDKAKAKGLDGIICGHIHKQERRNKLLSMFIGKVVNEGVEYINCGDGLTHGTSVMHEVFGNSASWSFLKPEDIPSQAYEILAPENPLAAYRTQSLSFLQQAWKAHVEHLRKKAPFIMPETKQLSEPVPVAA